MHNIIKFLTTFTINVAVVLIVLALLSGCSVITETECRYADFAQLGYADASKGRQRNYFTQYDKKCLNYDIDISDELVLYDFGRERGLLNYCNNARFSNQCDRDTGDVRARTIAEASVEFKRLESEIPAIKP